MITFIAKLLVALNSNSRPGELASGIAFGFWLALIPGGNLLWIALFIPAFLLKHNLAAFLLSLGLFRLFIFTLDPFLDFLGAAVLTSPLTENFFTWLNRLPLLAYTRFSNTLVMGGFLLGLIGWIPLFFLFRLLVILYRKNFASRIAESRLMKGLKGIPIVSKIIAAAGKLSPLAG